MSEKVKILFDHIWDYLITPVNAVGATTSLTLRTAETPSGDIAYVRKFGLAHTIKDLSDLSDPGVANLTWTVKTVDGVTTYGSRANGGAYSDGSTTAELTAIILECSASGGASTLPASMTLTDADFGALTVILPQETVADGDTLILYISAGGSSYYSTDYRHGGARHVPVLGSNRYSYFDPINAHSAVAASNDDGIEFLDSATYDYIITMNKAGVKMYATLGQTPTLTKGTGSRVTREVAHDGNNVDTAYVSKEGSDSTGDGTWALPYLTNSYAITNRGARTYINIKDSNTYNEVIAINVGITFEPIYGQTPKLTYSAGADEIVLITDVDGSIYGFEIDGENVTNMDGIAVEVVAYVGTIQDNTIHNISIGAGSANAIFCTGQNGFAGLLKANLIYDGSGGIYITTAVGFGGSAEDNIIHDTNGDGGYDPLLYQVNGAGACTVDVKNNLVYDCIPSGIWIEVDDWSGVCENNTIEGNGITGLYVDINAGAIGTIRNNISVNHTVDLQEGAGSVPLTITESCYLVNAGFTLGAGMIQLDPQFSSITDDKYGLSWKVADGTWSPASGTDTDDNDMGCKFHVISVQANDITINGIKIDGQDQMFCGIKKTGDYTGLTIKWCDTYNLYGASVDVSGTVDSDVIITNCKIYNNYNGVKLSYGGNTVKENSIYNNNSIGIHSNYVTQIFNHNILHLNAYGIYFEGDSGNITFKNSIIHSNSAYGIYSDVSLIINNCCITDATFNVTIADNNNITENPLFVSETSGSEDFHLKTIARGNVKESPCLNVADDDYDMGAYLETRLIVDESWTKYDLDVNPTNLDDSLPVRGGSKKVSAFASTYSFGKGRKKVLPFRWSDDTYMTEEQWKTFLYISGLVQMKENLLTRDEILVRISLLPTSFVDSGSSATVDATAKTITDGNKSLVKNEHSNGGYWASLRFETLTSGVVTASTKIIKVPGKSWDDDEHNGRYYMYRGNPLLILDTLNADELYVSDKNGVLEDETYTTYIEYYFEILSNSGTVIRVDDPYSMLIDGSFDYYIDFILCLVTSTNFRPRPPGFAPKKQHWKTGYEITFEQA